MARIRTIKPAFFRSRSLAKVSRDARLTFQGLWCEADDAGNGVADPRILVGAIWPLDDDVGWEQVRDHLSELAATGHIRLYQSDGDDYYSIVKFEEHQAAAYRRGDAQYPPPPDTPPDQGSRGAVQPARGDVQAAPDGVLEGNGREGNMEGNGKDTVAGLALVPSGAADPVRAVFDAWRESTSRDRAVLDDKRRRVIKQALADYPLGDVLAAVRGWRHSPHHRGENERRTVYNDIGLLLRDSAHIEKFRDLEHGTEQSPQSEPAGFDGIRRAIGGSR